MASDKRYEHGFLATFLIFCVFVYLVVSMRDLYLQMRQSAQAWLYAYGFKEGVTEVFLLGIAALIYGRYLSKEIFHLRRLYKDINDNGNSEADELASMTNNSYFEFQLRLYTPDFVNAPLSKQACVWWTVDGSAAEISRKGVTSMRPLSAHTFKKRWLFLEGEKEFFAIKMAGSEVFARQSYFWSSLISPNTPHELSDFLERKERKDEQFVFSPGWTNPALSVQSIYVENTVPLHSAVFGCGRVRRKPVQSEMSDDELDTYAKLKKPIAPVYLDKVIIDANGEDSIKRHFRNAILLKVVESFMLLLLCLIAFWAVRK